MSLPLHYETPENVRIEYRPAGLGTRFLASFIDGIIVNLLLFLTIVLLIIFAAAADQMSRDFFKRLDEWISDPDEPKDPERIGMYVVGIGVLIYGLGSFFYFALSELAWRGQTIGKRMCKIRVAKIDGFALDVAGVLLRNVFRVIDNFPILWIVPLLSKRSQRLGDMVAGTIVISDDLEELAGVRQQLAGRNVAEARFRFDQAKLSKLKQTDFDAIERILDRWNSIPADQQKALLTRLVGPLCRKMAMEEPPQDQRVEFLEDLLAAEYRRQDRQLR